MGIMDMIKDQFVDVIEFVDDGNKLIVYKYDRGNNEIKEGAQVIVREGQAAVFLKGGQLADILFPGTYTLKTGNLPILSTLEAFEFGFNSPIKADLYFVSTRQFVGQKWGTPNPIIVRDREFNMVRLRAFGKYAFRVVDVERFMDEIFGAIGKVLTFDIIDYFTAIMIEAVGAVLGKGEMPILDLAVHYRKLSSEILELSNQKASATGIQFTEILIENISLPDEVEKMLDEQSGIGMAGKDMDTFMQYHTARAMRDASKQEGGLAGLGAGMALGNTMAGTIQGAAAGQKADSVAKLREYKALLDEGILTKEEFDAMKKELLGL